MRGKVDGYFTVEATIVLPIVLGTMVAVIYLLIFQYNRCLMEQDMGVLALRGVVMQTKDGEERLRLMKQDAEGFYKDKYIAWRSGEIKLRQEKGNLYVEWSGEMTIPFCESSSMWTSYENHIVSPVFFVRNYRKLRGE